VKTHKAILKKIEEWEGNPMLVAGMYRLFAYLPWSLVPEKYKEFFPEDAKEAWLKDDGTYTEEDLKQDIESEIAAILNTIAKRNITNAFGIVPMMLADLFIMNKRIGSVQGKLFKVINNYKENVVLDRQLAEQYAMFEIFDVLKEIVKKVGIKNTMLFDIDKAFDQVVEASQKVNQDVSNVTMTPEIHEKIEEALKKEKEENKKDEANL